MLVVYHIKPNAEESARQLIGQLWETYQREGMVFSKPHVRVESREGERGYRIVEIISWQGNYTMEYPPESVKELLARIKLLCEERNGNPAIEFRDVEILAPR
jgi:hypothetical protein